MNRSDNIQNLAAALVKAHANIGGAIKDAANPFFKSRYATLGDVIIACKSALAAEGIAVSQLITTAEGGGPALETILMHSSGEWIGATMPIICAKQNDPQALGSAITYCRRYALQSTLLIPAVDDDGEAAMFRAEPPSTQNGAVSAQPNGKNAFPGGDPRQVPVHVGVNKGLRLHELNPQQIHRLDTEWREHVETDGTISEQDQLLLDALTFCRPPAKPKKT